MMSSPLTVGLMRVVLHLPDSGSLKSKRMVVSGLLRRVRQQLKVAAAEVGELDRWQLAELAVAVRLDVSEGRRQHLVGVASVTADGCDGARITDVSTELVRL